MKLSAFVAWLSRRFPEQLTVTKRDWTELREEVASYNVVIQNQQHIVDRIASIEKRLTQLEAANGFVKGTKGGFQLER